MAPETLGDKKLDSFVKGRGMVRGCLYVGDIVPVGEYEGPMSITVSPGGGQDIQDATHQSLTPLPQGSTIDY